MSAWAWAPPLITMVPDIIRLDHATGTTTTTRAIAVMRSIMARSSWKASPSADLTTIAGSMAGPYSGIVAAGTIGMAGRGPILAGTMAKAGAGTAAVGIAVGVMTIGAVETAVVKFATSMGTVVIVMLAIVMTTTVTVVTMIMTRVIAIGDIALTGWRLDATVIPRTSAEWVDRAAAT